jgi:hypothetical protein
MRDIVYPSAALALWIAVIYKLNDLRRDRENPALRALCLALVFPAVAFTTETPMFFSRIDRVPGEPEIAKLLVHGSLVAFSALVQRLLLLWSYPVEQARPKIRFRVGAAVIVLVVMAVLFVLGPVDRPTSEFTAAYATTPFITEYLIVFLGAVAVGLIEISRLCWLFARASDQAWLVRGLRVTAVGATVGMGYCVGRGVYVIGRILGVDLRLPYDAAPACAAAGAVLVAMGLTLPAWGPNTTRFTEAVRRIGHYRRLRKLWLVLYRAKPDIALDGSTSKWWDPWWPFRVRQRIYRLVIEIHDGMLASPCRSDAAVAAAAAGLGRSAGLRGEELEATVQAAVLRAALTTSHDYVASVSLSGKSDGEGGGSAQAGSAQADAARDGGPEPSGAGDRLGDGYVSTREGADLASEVEWFLKVERAYRQSPVVLAAASQVGSGAPAPIRAAPE